jgi:hypothetical protein
MLREHASNFETWPGGILVCKFLVSFKNTTPKISVVLHVTQLWCRPCLKQILSSDPYMCFSITYGFNLQYQHII